MARLPSFVTRVDTARGVRYEARINTGLSTGKRLQQRKRFASLEEAKA
jgi:integrase